MLDQKNILHFFFAYGDWHEGFKVLLLLKLFEKTKKNLFLLRPPQKEALKGSARTFENIHLLDILKKTNIAFLKYIGHKSSYWIFGKKNSLNLESILEA